PAAATPPPAAPPATVRPPFTPQPYVPPAGQARTPQPYTPQAAQPHARPAPPSPPDAQAAPARKGKFTVQVASFKEQAQAHELLAQLKASGHPAYLVTTNLEGVGTRFRVRVGPYPDLDAAQGAAARIRMQLLLAAYVTKEE
ncbi:MAG: SPOR domain-containing protein, partial [Pseudomonadota bacterium]